MYLIRSMQVKITFFTGIGIITCFTYGTFYFILLSSWSPMGRSLIPRNISEMVHPKLLSMRSMGSTSSTGSTGNIAGMGSTGDTGNTGSNVSTSSTGNTGSNVSTSNTGNIGGTGHAGNTGDLGDRRHTAHANKRGNIGKRRHRVNIGNTGNTSNTENSLCSGDPHPRTAPRRLVFEPHQLQGYKKILYWNDVFGLPDFHFGLGQEPFLRNKCPVDKCFATNNRTLFSYEELDAVYWSYYSNDKTFPPTRSSHTVYMYFNIEYPYFGGMRYQRNLKGVFNWTNTYRRDSDFVIPYGLLEPLSPDQVTSRPVTNYAAAKTKMAAWFVSHCHTISGRQQYVDTLQKYLTVDIFGKCGPGKCKKTDDLGCTTSVFRDYKFYLAFENSVCADYITEKLYNTLQNDIVPVVFGSGYSSAGLPNMSYINVFDFESVKHLADYLKYLDSNDTAYNQYFSWKGKYAVVGKWQLHRRVMCSACERLHKMDPKSPYADPNLKKKFTNNAEEEVKIFPSYRKVYNNIVTWFVNESRCYFAARNPQFSAFLHGKTKTEIRLLGLKGQPGIPSIADRPNTSW